MWLIFFGIIKEFLKSICNFFLTPIGRVIALIIISILIVMYSYNKGVDDGVASQIALYEKQYNDKLNLALSKYQTSQQIANDIGAKLSERQDKLNQLYLINSNDIKQILKSSKEIKGCALTTEHNKQILDKLDSIK